MSAEYSQIPPEQLEVYLNTAAQAANEAFETVYEEDRPYVIMDARDMARLHSAGLYTPTAQDAEAFLHVMDIHRDALDFMLKKAKTHEEKEEMKNQYWDDPQGFAAEAKLQYIHDAYAMKQPMPSEKKDLPAPRKSWAQFEIYPVENENN